MQLTQLRGLRIISLSEALKMGAVEDILLDPTCRWIAALRVQSSRTEGKSHLMMRQTVKRVGQHAIILGAPTSTTQDPQAPSLDRLIDLKTFLGLEVVSDEAILLGRVQDAEIDPETLSVLAYDLARNFWQRSIQSGWRVLAEDTLSGSKDVLVVPQSALHKRGTITEPTQLS